MLPTRSEIRMVIHPDTGERWYAFVDVCDRLGLDIACQKKALPEENLWKLGMPKSWLVDGVGVLRLLMRATRPEAREIAFQLLKDMTNTAGLVDKVINGLERVVETKAPTKKKHVSATDVRQWLRLKEEGLTWAEIGLKAGRHRSVIQTYCTPETTPKFIQITVFDMPY